ncbi:hypothetical protein E6C27_scaffold2484G00700 [Cucumis melo var. makuwa]|uniref:Uncharacterized protein n=1 Tax=Cucumis melo var. makuwa TaxID=1194695 RepID=A0A5A7VKX3_CUCMM|nr:hypothetical protein E6C27_scaffold2484G00700 [Cucumis melo var. makuwa]
MIKACPHHCIQELVLMEQFYFGLSEDTQQTVDAVFVGGMLRSSNNQIKTTLDTMVNEGVDRNTMVALEGKFVKMSKLQ